MSESTNNKIEPLDDVPGRPMKAEKSVKDISNYSSRIFRQKIKCKILKTGHETTTHGVPFICDKETLLLIRIFWIICFLASVSGFAYLCARSINTYLQYGVRTSINVIYENEPEFPTIMVCNQNQFVTDAAFTFVKEVLETNNVTDLYNSNYYGNFNSELTRAIVNYENANSLAAIATANYTNQSAFGEPYNEFILNCLFEANECVDMNFLWSYNTDYGNCYTFNAGYESSGRHHPISTVSKAGSSSGLQMLLNMGVPNNNYSFSMVNGARIFIYNNTLRLNRLQGIDVAVGTSTNIEISRTFQNHLPKPFNDCYDDLTDENSYDSDLYRAIIQSNSTYRQQDCYVLCYQREIINACNCYFTSYQQLFNAAPCSTRADLACANEVYGNLTKEGAQVLCSNDCPLECDTLTYSTSISFTSFPSEAYAAYLAQDPDLMKRFPGQTIDYDFINSNFLMLNVYYTELSYTLIDEEPAIELADLIASVGGLLGLFLGMSFLSFAEMIDMLLEIIYHLLRAMIRKRKMMKSNLPR